MKELKAPLSYQGGKQRVASKIADIIVSDTSNTNYIDLCCGSGAVSVGLVNKGVHPEDILMVDASDWGEFWSQVSNSNFDMDYFEYMIEDIPDNVSEIQDYLKQRSKETWALDEYINIIPLWLCLQAGSFGGKHIWSGMNKNNEGCFKNASFRSYWQPTATSSRRSPVNPMMPMPKTLQKQVKAIVEGMSPVKALCSDIRDIDWEFYDTNIRTKEKVVVFIDPPYENTTGYGFTLDYKSWLSEINLPENYSVWITDYQPHSDKFYSLNKTSKGGISGGSKTREEILSKVM